MRLKTIFSKQYWLEHPKMTFTAMVISIILSITVVSILNLNKKPTEQPSFSLSTKASKSLSGGMENISAIYDVIQLKKNINELINKNPLSHADSVQLLESLKDLERINKSLNDFKK